jgi:serine/threonine protein phosphatase PrpC
MHDNTDNDTVEVPPPVEPAEADSPRAWSSLVTVDVGALTNPGRVRPNNEDHFLAARFGRSLLTLKTNLPAGAVPDQFDDVGYVLVVADGVGGSSAGEVASSLAIAAGINLTLRSPKWNMIMTPEEVSEHMEKMRFRFRQIDQILTERARADAALAGMSTTFTGTYSIGANLFLYHVGDSRAYLFRGGRLVQLTRDHTTAQALADAGWITPEQVATHNLRHVLTRALGGRGGDVEVEIQHSLLADGDRLLLCTDGLTEMVPDGRIAEVLAHTEASEEACRALVELALEAGGKDNVTVVLARYTIPSPPAPAADGNGRAPSV